VAAGNNPTLGFQNFHLIIGKLINKQFQNENFDSDNENWQTRFIAVHSYQILEILQKSKVGLLPTAIHIVS
jgi:hypothetical protein